MVVALLAATVEIGIIAEWSRIPYAVVFLVASLASTFSIQAQFAPSILFIFLPALVIEASWDLDLTLMRVSWIPTKS